MMKAVIAIFLVAVVLFGAAFALNGVAEARAKQEHQWLLETLLPGSTEFTLEAYIGDDANIRSVHKGQTGYVIETATSGYADEIVMLVAVTNDGKVVGLVVEEAHETLGLGSKILTDHEFLAGFLNRSGSFTVGTPGADAFSGATGESSGAGEEITVDGISGATVSSKAVARCVTSAVAYVTGADASSSATSWGG